MYKKSEAVKQKRQQVRYVQQTARDEAVLRWVGDQFAIREDQLQILAARHTPAPDLKKLKDPYRLTVSGVRESLYRRWHRMGWIGRKKIFHGEPMWLWLSRNGVATFSSPYPYREPARSRLNHIYYVNTVRLYYEARLGAEATWVSERAISKRRKKAGATHLVDGELHYQGGVYGIEVELTAKSHARLDSILSGLAREYQGIYYLASESCYSTVEEAISRLPSPIQTKFLLNKLEPIVERVQTGTIPH